MWVLVVVGWLCQLLSTTLIPQTVLVLNVQNRQQSILLTSPLQRFFVVLLYPLRAHSLKMISSLNLAIVILVIVIALYIFPSTRSCVTTTAPWVAVVAGGLAVGVLLVAPATGGFLSKDLSNSVVGGGVRKNGGKKKKNAKPVHKPKRGGSDESDSDGSDSDESESEGEEATVDEIEAFLETTAKDEGLGSLEAEADTVEIFDSDDE